MPNEISHRGSKSPTIKIRGNDVNVSEKHISDVLTDAYKNFYDKLHPSDTPKIKKEEKLKKIIHLFQKQMKKKNLLFL